jgi:hypothetical protein
VEMGDFVVVSVAVPFLITVAVSVDIAVQCRVSAE